MERLARTNFPPEVKIIDANKLGNLSIPFFLRVEVYSREREGKNFFSVSQVVDTKSIFSYIAQMLKSEAGDEYVSKVILSMFSVDYDLEELFLETGGDPSKYGHLSKCTYFLLLDSRDSRISEDYLAKVISALDGGVLVSGLLRGLKMNEFGLLGTVSSISSSETIHLQKLQKLQKDDGSSKRRIKPVLLRDFVTLAVQETKDYWTSTNIPNSSSEVNVSLKLSEGMHFIPKDGDIKKLIFTLNFEFGLRNDVSSVEGKLYGKNFLSSFQSSAWYMGKLALKIGSILVEKVNKVYSNKDEGTHVFHVKGNIEMVPLLVVAEASQESSLKINITNDLRFRGFFFEISRNLSYFPVVRDGEKRMVVRVFDVNKKVNRDTTLRSFLEHTGDFLKVMREFSEKFIESALAKPVEELVSFLVQESELCVSGRRVPFSNILGAGSSEVSPEKFREQMRSSLKELLEKRNIAYSKATLDMFSSNLSESLFPLHRQEEHGEFRFVPYSVNLHNSVNLYKERIHSLFTFLRADRKGAGESPTTIAVEIVPSEEISSEDRVFTYNPIFKTLDKVCPDVKLRYSG